MTCMGDRDIRSVVSRLSDILRVGTDDTFSCRSHSGCCDEHQGGGKGGWCNWLFISGYVSSVTVMLHHVNNGHKIISLFV